MDRPASTSAFGRIADRFVPTAAFDGDVHLLRRLRLVARGSLFFLLIPLLPASVLFVYGRYPLMLAPAAITLSSATCLWMIRAGYRPTTIARLLIGVTICSLSIASFVLGGITAPMVPALLVHAPVASMLSGRTLARSTAVVVGVLLIALGLQSDDPVRVFRTIGFLSVHLALAVLVDWLSTISLITIDTERAANQALSQANDELRAARAELVHSLKARDRLLAVVSHEIRNPINGIMGIAELLRASAESDEQREHIELLGSTSQDMLELVNRLLDHAKLAAGGVDIERVPFTISALVGQARRMLVQSANRRGLQLTTVVDGTLMRPVLGDPIRVRQILDNLLSNALKFTERGCVLVNVFPETTTDTEVTARFEIEDTGIGLTTDEQATIFAEFTQATTATTRKYGGTGLGLSISKKLVEMMGGQIGVISQPGVGSTFWFTLSFQVVESPGEQTQSQRSSESHQSDGANDDDDDRDDESGPAIAVLLVEDNPLNRKVTAALLRSLGCHVEIAHDGRQALQALSRRDYDLVFMDCHMPTMDGFSATRAIRTRERNRSRRTPVIALTGTGTDDAQRACLDAGMDECLIKPIVRSKLKDTLSRWRPDHPMAS